jgi:hypothetical protein
MRSELLAAAVAVACSSSLMLYACHKQRDVDAPPTQERAVSAVEHADDRSRCEFEGRADREVVETANSRAIQPNIRRVYAIMGQGEDARRVLQCREVDTNLDGVKDVVRTYNDDGESLHEQADSDFDGRIDTWTTFAGGRVSEVQVDRDRDGQPDEKRVYVHGEKIRAELDENHDGKPDVWEIYDQGILQRRGVDVDADGKVDRWDRDEIAYRRAEQKEREAEELREREAREAEADAGVTDARVSARSR